MWTPPLSISGTFSSSQRLHSLSDSPAPLSAGPWSSHFYSVPMNLSIPGAACEQNHAVSVLLSLTLDNVFQVYPCPSTCHCFYYFLKLLWIISTAFLYWVLFLRGVLGYTAVSRTHPCHPEHPGSLCLELEELVRHLSSRCSALYLCWWKNSDDDGMELDGLLSGQHDLMGFLILYGMFNHRISLSYLE